MRWKTRLLNSTPPASVLPSLLGSDDHRNGSLHLDLCRWTHHSPRPNSRSRVFMTRNADFVFRFSLSWCRRAEPAEKLHFAAGVCVLSAGTLTLRWIQLEVKNHGHHVSISAVSQFGSWRWFFNHECVSDPFTLLDRRPSAEDRHDRVSKFQLSFVTTGTGAWVRPPQH